MATSTGAISTYRVYLKYKKLSDADTTPYEKLVDIKDFPDLGGEPELLETTTLSDGVQTYIPGIQSLDSFTFTANYVPEDYKKLRGMMDDNQEYKFAVYFGEDGSNGMWTFQGKLSVFPTGGGVNEVVNMTISIATTTEIKFDDSKIEVVTNEGG